MQFFLGSLLISLVTSGVLAGGKPLIDAITRWMGGSTEMDLQKMQLEREIAEATATREATTRMRLQDATKDYLQNKGLIEATRIGAQADNLSSAFQGGSALVPPAASMMPGSTLNNLFDLVL